MSISNYRKQLQRVLAALQAEEELTQSEHFELLRLIAGKQNEKAVALLHKIQERKANVIRIKTRLTYLEFEEAEKLLKQQKEDDTK